MAPPASGAKGRAGRRRAVVLPRRRPARSRRVGPRLNPRRAPPQHLRGERDLDEIKTIFECAPRAPNEYTHLYQKTF